jgi:hypothetical protein
MTVRLGELRFDGECIGSDVVEPVLAGLAALNHQVSGLVGVVPGVLAG